MKDKEYVYELTLDEALQKLDYTLYDRNCDIRVIKARQQLIDVIRNETNKLKKDLEVLEILKKCEDDKHSLYCVSVLNALSSGKITQDDVIKVKEWLNGKD